MTLKLQGFEAKRWENKEELFTRTHLTRQTSSSDSKQNHRASPGCALSLLVQFQARPAGVLLAPGRAEGVCAMIPPRLQGALWHCLATPRSPGDGRWRNGLQWEPRSAAAPAETATPGVVNEQSVVETPEPWGSGRSRSVRSGLSAAKSQKQQQRTAGLNSCSWPPVAFSLSPPLPLEGVGVLGFP